MPQLGARFAPCEQNLSFVLPGHSRPKHGVASLAYDPGIHEAAPRSTTLQIAFVDTHHGLPGQARQRRTRGSVRTSPGKDARGLVAVEADSCKLHGKCARLRTTTKSNRSDRSIGEET